MIDLQRGRQLLRDAESNELRGALVDAESASIEAADLFSQGSDDWLAALARITSVSAKLGNVSRLQTTVRELCEWLPTTESEAYVVALSRATNAVMSGGWSDLSRALLDRLSTLENDPVAALPHAAAWLLLVRAQRTRQSSDPTSAIPLFEEVVERFEKIGDVRSAAVQRINTGFLYLMVGANVLAHLVLCSACESSERLGFVFVAAAAKQNLGLALSRLRRFDEAIPLARESADAFRANRNARMESTSRQYLSAMLVETGQKEQAEVEARRARGLAARGTWQEAVALGALANVQLARDDVGAALATTETAMLVRSALAETNEDEVAVLLVRAEALFRGADRAQARSAIEEARALLLERAAALDPRWRDGFLQNVPAHRRTQQLAAAWARATE